jgi:hypothetical protein
MSRNVERHKYWLVPAFMLVAGVILLCGWQQLHAQGVPAGTPGVPPSPAPPAAAPAAEPTVAMTAVVTTGIKSASIKNWDGQVTGMLGFKYKTLDDRVIKVQLPAVYRTQQMTRAAWDTLFQCYGMDVEAHLAASEQDSLFGLDSATVDKIVKQYQRQSAVKNLGQDANAAPNPAAPAMDFAKMSMPAVSNGMSLPPLIPGLF